MDSNNSNMVVSAVAHVTANAVSNTSDPAKAVASENNRVAKTATQPTEGIAPQRDPRSLQFQVDGDRVITTIIDENDKTVVIQIPDAEVIRIAKAIDRMQGFLLEQKA
jgi:flagellar protein FlaG